MINNLPPAAVERARFIAQAAPPLNADQRAVLVSVMRPALVAARSRAVAAVAQDQKR